MRRQAHIARANRHSKPLPRMPEMPEEDLLELVERTEDPLLLILDRVTDPHNLGACLRASDGAGVTAVVVPRRNAVSLNDTVRRVACGAADSIPLARVGNLARTMRSLSELGVRMVGSADEADQTIYDADLTGPLALVMGAEGEGLRRLTVELCDELVSIPMAGHVECLNVAVAAGVCLFEATRQRHFADGSA